MLAAATDAAVLAERASRAALSSPGWYREAALRRSALLWHALGRDKEANRDLRLALAIEPDDLDSLDEYRHTDRASRFDPVPTELLDQALRRDPPPAADKEAADRFMRAIPGLPFWRQADAYRAAVDFWLGLGEYEKAADALRAAREPAGEGTPTQNARLAARFPMPEQRRAAVGKTLSQCVARSLAAYTDAGDLDGAEAAPRPPETSAARPPADSEPAGPSLPPLATGPARPDELAASWRSAVSGDVKPRRALKALGRPPSEPVRRAKWLVLRGLLGSLDGDPASARSDFAEAVALDAAAACDPAAFPDGRERIPVDYFDACLKRYSGRSDLRFERGMACYEAGRRDEAAADFRKARELDPYLSAASISLASLLAEEKRWDEALAVADAAAAEAGGPEGAASPRIEELRASLRRSKSAASP